MSFGKDGLDRLGDRFEEDLLVLGEYLCEER